MTKEQLIEKISEAEENCTVDPDTFGGSPEEFAYADGKSDAYGDARVWIESYFETEKK